MVGGACRASGEHASSEVPLRLFDGRLGTKWLDFGGGGEKGWAWAQYQLLQGQAPLVVTHYDVISANDCPERDPTDWRLEGWVQDLPAAAAAAGGSAPDGSSQQQGRWAVLHEVNDVSWSGRHQLRSFFLPAAGCLPCSCWRLAIGRTAQQAAANSVQLCGWSLYAPGQQQQQQQEQEQPYAASEPPSAAQAMNGHAAQAGDALAAAAALPYMDLARAIALRGLAEQQQSPPLPQVRQGAAAAAPAGPDDGPRSPSPVAGPVALLRRILANLQQHPEEDKYGKIRAAKVEELLACGTCSVALLAAGFRPLLLEGGSDLALCFDRQEQRNKAAVAALLLVLDGA